MSIFDIKDTTWTFDTISEAVPAVECIGDIGYISVLDVLIRVQKVDPLTYEFEYVGLGHLLGKGLTARVHLDQITALATAADPHAHGYLATQRSWPEAVFVALRYLVDGI